MTRQIQNSFVNTKIPLITLVFLALLFFFAMHDLFFSLRDNTETPSYTQLKAAAEGNLTRRVCFVMLGLFGAFGLMRRGQNRFTLKGSLGWLIIIYHTWALVSIVWTDDIGLTFRRFLVLEMLCLGALAVSKHFSLKNLTWFVFISTGIYLIIGLTVELAFGTFHPLSADYRFTGTLHQNQQGINCALILISSIILGANNKKGRGIFITCALISLIFSFLTKSRTPFIFSVMVFAGYAFFSLSRSGKIAMVLTIGFILSLLLLIAGETVLSTARTGILLGRTDDVSLSTFTGRLPKWEVCMDYVKKRPYFGYGYGSFWTPTRYVATTYGQNYGKGGQISSSNNLYIETLLSLGVIGMLIYIFMLLNGIWRSYLFYKASFNKGYIFLGLLLAFCAFDGLIEDGFIAPGFATFLIWTSLFYLGFQRKYI